MGAAWQMNQQQREQPSTAATQAQRKPASAGRHWRLTFYLLLVSLVLAATALVVFESRSAHFQSRELSRYAASLTYQVEPGPSERIIYPTDGPFDKRQGYAYLPLMLERLQQHEYRVTEQSRFSEE